MKISVKKTYTKAVIFGTLFYFVHDSLMFLQDLVARTKEKKLLTITDFCDKRARP